MITRIELSGIPVDVVRKDIKNIHLGVYPPTGAVRIAAPMHVGLETIRLFAIGKLAWIRRQQSKLRTQERDSPREYLDRESHYLWGRRYLLRVVEKDAAPAVELGHRRLLLQVRPGSGADKRRSVLDDWYRTTLKQAALVLMAKWQPILGVEVERVFVQRMKTRWGGCNPRSRSIRLNTELARKPSECLEYIVVHEMAHLLEPTHGARFQALMDRVLPAWEFQRARLNQLPVGHEQWR